MVDDYDIVVDIAGIGNGDTPWFQGSSTIDEHTTCSP